MNRFVLFIWAFIMASIFGIILTIGYREKNNEENIEYRDYISNIKEISNKYLAKKKINLKYNTPEIIFYSDLKEAELLDEEDENKYCIKSIIVTKGILKNEYEISKDCELVNATE